MKNPTANITAPSNPPYLWGEEPKQRGTFGIITICLTTVFVCTWNTVHFNVPTRRYTSTRHLFVQVSWTILALVAPALLLYVPMNDRITAGVLSREVLKFHPHLAKPTMLARIRHWIRGRVESKGTAQPHFGLVRAFYAVMGGFAFDGSFDDNKPTVEESDLEIAANPRGTVDVPRFETLIYIMKHFPHIILNIPEETILDRAESSSLKKVFLIVQGAWFGMNCSSRLFQGLPLSLLEVSTAGHIFCALFTYLAWWSKPMNVAAHTLLRGKEAQEVHALLKCSSDEYDEALGMATKRAAGESSTPTGPQESAKIVLAANALQRLLPNPERPPLNTGFKNPDGGLFPWNLGNKAPNEAFYAVITIIISPIPYGLVHLLAWSNKFPTTFERLLWRVSSFAITCSGIVGIPLLWTFVWFYQRPNTRISLDVLAAIISVIPVVHILASGFLMVESFRQVFFLDPAAYQLPSWSIYLPHLS